MTEFPRLESERLNLRELDKNDAQAMFGIHSDSAAMRWYGSAPISDVEAAEKLIEVFKGWRQLPNPGVRWGIERKSDNRLLGSCGFFKWNRSWKSCTIGYELDREVWGKGYMREALSVIIPWGFQHMELNRLEAQIHPENAASIKLVHRLGFVEEGILREAGYWDGNYHNLLQYSLLLSEYKPS